MPGSSEFGLAEACQYHSADEAIDEGRRAAEACLHSLRELDIQKS